MIYADHNANSPLLDSVKDYLKKRFDKEDIYANPSSLHSLGKKVNHALEQSRSICAKSIGADPEQIIFNSGASEGISHIFASVLNTTDKKTIITSGQEHAAVEQTCDYYQTLGYTVKVVKSLPSGLIDLDDLKKLLNDEVALVSIIAVNNETGVIQPYNKIGKLCKEQGIAFFPDTTQLLGKIEFNFNQSDFDYAVISGHKLGALPGSGFLVAKNPVTLKPNIFGGYQESGKRAGTQNYLGIETLAVAMSEINKKMTNNSAMKTARDNFESSLKKSFPDVKVFGDSSERLAGVSLLGFKGIHGQAVQLELESYDVFVTTSSACSDNEPETSKVLKSMGIADDLGRSAIRISLSVDQQPEDFKVIGEKLDTIYRRLGKIKY